MKADFKILDNFEPYNDIWYKNCFYHALFPIIKHFNRDIFPFIVNDIFIYKYNNSKVGVEFDLEIIEKDNIEKILEDMSISVFTKVESPNILEDLIDSINNERPVIIYIDQYYESIRPDSYQKNHWGHTLLIYGYNNIEESFNIIEHRYRDCFLYEKRIMSYSDVEKCYNGFIANFQKEKKYPTYYEYTMKHSDPSFNKYNIFKKSDYVDMFFENLQENRKAIYNGIENIKLFTGDYKKMVFDEMALKNNVDSLLDSLNRLVGNKNLERYYILKLLDSKLSSIELCNAIINDWNFIRSIIGKYQLTLKYNLKSFEKTIEKLIEIYELEYQWYDSLFSLYSQYSQVRD